jgi:uncharacterized integral membrane protein (TIGR00698 family)
VARLLSGVLPPALSEVTVAIVIGLVVGLVVDRVSGGGGSSFRPGLRVAASLLLRLGIVLLGARLGLGEIARIGLPAAALVALTMVAAFGLVLALARAGRIDPALAVLLAVGTAVCGNSAIVATAPAIAARPRDVMYAIATITLFGMAAVFVYPIVGHALGMTDVAFGAWAGVAVNDTSQVVAAASTYSPAALDVATVVKLIRNAMMAPLLVAIAWGWTRRTGESGDVRAGVRRAVPVFVLGFVALAAARTLGLISADLASALDVVSRWLILVALAAVGLSMPFRELRETGPRPLAVGLVAAVVIGVGTLVAIAVLARAGTAG